MSLQQSVLSWQFILASDNNRCFTNKRESVISYLHCDSKSGIAYKIIFYDIKQCRENWRLMFPTPSISLIGAWITHTLNQYISTRNIYNNRFQTSNLHSPFVSTPGCPSERLGKCQLWASVKPKIAIKVQIWRYIIEIKNSKANDYLRPVFAPKNYRIGSKSRIKIALWKLFFLPHPW